MTNEEKMTPEEAIAEISFLKVAVNKVMEQALDMAIQALSQEPPTFNWVQNRVDLAKAEINNAIESTFCTKDEAIGLGIALDVIDKYFTI